MTTKSKTHWSTAHVCTTQQQLEEVVAAYAQFDEFVFDVETRGEYRSRPERAEVAWIGLAGPGRTDIIPMGHINGKLITAARVERKMRRNLDGSPLLTEEGKRQFDSTPHPPVFGPKPQQLWPSDVFEALRPLFFSERRKIGHNVKFDLGALAKYYDGEVPPPPYGDTISLVHLLNEKMGAYRLDFVIKKIYGLAYSDGKIGRIGIDEFDFETVAHYLRLDVFYTWLLWRDYFSFIEKQDLTRVFNVEMGVLESLIYMERVGAPIDMSMMDRLSTRINKRVEEITRELYRDFGKPWNLDNPVDKGHYVYKVRKHTPRFFTEKKQQPSTKAEHLTVYAKRDPMVALLAEYSELAKLKSTYIDGMRTRLVEERLHPAFLQAGTETGRFSCANPNLQNLPRDSDERKEYSIRSLFIAPPGHVLIAADYSQIEYRLFAHFSRDPYMTKMFLEGFDAHTAMASMLLGKKPEELSPEERTVYGKTVNFALGFGAGPNTLADQAGITIKHAKRILGDHRDASPLFYAWKDREIKLARQRRPPHVVTLLGRKRRLPTLFASEDKVRWKAERQAINTIVQGSAADIMKIAMVRAHKRLVDTPVQPILTVHDELVSICPEGMEDEAIPLIRKAMEGAAKLRVPLVADINVGKRWSEAKG